MNTSARLLVVDDERETREYLAELLTAVGYQVAAAENGLEALDKIRQQRPCVVLLDLAMPLLNGFGFVEATRSDPELLPPVPIICVSGWPDALQEAQRLGIQDCLIKPIEPNELLEHVRRYCRR
jgi:CheY-like chemotaxis protein